MALADEVYQSKHSKEPKKKEKKSFSEAFIPHRGDSKKEIGSKIFTLFALLVLIVCIAVLAVYFYHQYEAKSNNDKINVIYNNAVSKNEHVTEAPDIAAPEVPEEQRAELVRSAAAEEMLAINPDYVGYLYIPDVLKEPVVQRDNEYYLKHNFYDQTRAVGTVFSDPRTVINDYSDKQSDNIVLYGHNNRDGSMFGNLDYYKWDLKYWLKNPFVYFDNFYENYTYVIISSFVVNTKPEHDNGNVFDYTNFTNFSESGKYTFDNFKSEITSRSQISTGIDFNENDKYLTLSTCSYEWDEARHVIVARRLRADESVETIDTTNFAVSDNPKWPAIYYKYNAG